MNELAHHANLYLRQHGGNPIHWKAWSEGAWAKARAENKLVIVSIGYSACHWCHVMELECFEDDDIAIFTNAHYVSIKVDREERPDIDQSYMSAVQLMGKPGGWPLNCICLPDGTPVFGGTYFPKTKWFQILSEIHQLYQKSPHQLHDYATQIKSAIEDWDATIKKNEIDFSLDHDAIQSWISEQDMEWGGTAHAPKFPMPPLLHAMLEYGHYYPLSKKWALNSLHKMAMGGIHDPVQGGFSRYSVDAFWHIPHFEKMLYDNGQLMSAYSKAFALDPKPEYRLAIESIDRWYASITHPKSGLLFSAQDADSEGEEGKYYSYSIQEIEQCAGDDFQLLNQLYFFQPFCQWEEKKLVLRQKISLTDWAIDAEINIEDALAILERFHAKLRSYNEHRMAPAIDQKILTTWNALAVLGYTESSYIFPDYLEKAEKLFHQMTQHLQVEGHWTQGKYEAGYLTTLLSDTLATVQKAALALFYRTTKASYYQSALDCQKMLLEFRDNQDSLYFLGKGDDVFVQKKEITDSVQPSVNATICQNLYLMGVLEGRSQWIEESTGMMAQVAEIGQHPAYSAQWLQQWMYRQHGGIVIACHAHLDEIWSIRQWGIQVIELNQPSEVYALLGKYKEEKQFHLCTFESCSTPFTDFSSLQAYFLSQFPQ